jgi:hypothetical protein
MRAIKLEHQREPTPGLKLASRKRGALVRRALGEMPVGFELVRREDRPTVDGGQRDCRRLDRVDESRLW